MNHNEKEARNYFAQEILADLDLQEDVLAEILVSHKLDLEVLEFTLNGETLFAYGAPFEAAQSIRARIRAQYPNSDLAFGLDSVQLSQLHRYPDLLARYSA